MSEFRLDLREGILRKFGCLAAMMLSVSAPIYPPVMAKELQAAPSQATPGTCSDATLRGGFAVTAAGQHLDGKPIAQVSRVAFDGKGGFIVKGSSSDNGVLSLDREFEGRYKLEADCTGTVSYTDGSTNLLLPAGYFVYAPTTGELRLVASDADIIANVFARRQFSAGTAAACDVSSIKGKFISNGSGPILGSGSFAAVGILEFDGKGGLSVRRTLNFNGKMLPDKAFHATYKVAADCSGLFTYASEAEFSPRASTTYDSFVIGDDGKQVWIFSANPGRALTVQGALQFDGAAR